MPTDASGWFSLILAIGGVASFVGLALMRTNQTTLRETNNDLRSQLGDIKAARAEEQAECAKQHAEDQARIAELENENTALGRVVTGEVHLVAIAQRIEDLFMLIKDYIAGRSKDRG
jgi:hypothetical protein